MVSLKKEEAKKDESSLPVARIRTIMKSGADPDVACSLAAGVMVTKATELFIKYLAKESYKINEKKSSFTYDELSETVQKKKKLEFLHQIVPKKITIREIRKLMAKESDDESTSSDSEDEDGSGKEDGDKVETISSSSSSSSRSNSECGDEKDVNMKDNDVIEIDSSSRSTSRSSSVICLSDKGK